MPQDNRPLSPHLQIYRPQLTSILSILHRATGVFLSIGLIAFTYWFYSLSAGQESFEQMEALVGSLYGRTLLFAWTFSLFYHLCNGIRHLFWDAGKGFDLAHVYRSGIAVVVSSVLLSGLSWFIAYYQLGSFQ